MALTIPRNGHRFNPHKLLIDPYAKLLDGKFVVERRAFRLPHRQPARGSSFRPARQRARHAEIGADRFRLYLGRKSGRITRRSDSIIYEAHVRGLQMNNERIPMACAATFAGLGSRPIVDHLVKLGVTAIELLPVHAFVDDRPLVQRGLE